MASRLLAAGLLLVSALLAWLAVTFTLAARLLQLTILLSMVYVTYLAWHGSRVMWSAFGASRSGAGIATGNARDLPWVTVVVPARDEARVLGRLLVDLAQQRYHAGKAARFDVVVVDDGSLDDTAAIARAAGVTVLQRPPEALPRTKGAALAHALPSVRGEVLAVLDADARVEPDFLERTIRAWKEADPAAASVQAQRRPDTERRGWLAGAQADEQLMDLASQCGRWATDGTAELRGNGMFVRREALERVGGWSPAALTEDLELSTRLVAAGEHVAMAPAAVVREEAVGTLAALWRQRLRWAEGSLRRLMEHGPGLLSGPLPLGRKLDFVAFIGEFVVPPLFVITVLTALIAMAVGQTADWTVPISVFAAYGVGTFVLALAGLGADGLRGVTLLGRAARGALFLSHWLLVVPAALALIAFGPRTRTFAKTPRALIPPGR